jgi:hypothetical protein
VRHFGAAAVVFVGCERAREQLLGESLQRLLGLLGIDGLLLGERELCLTFV